MSEKPIWLYGGNAVDMSIQYDDQNLPFPVDSTYDVHLVLYSHLYITPILLQLTCYDIIVGGSLQLTVSNI